MEPGSPGAKQNPGNFMAEARVRCGAKSKRSQQQCQGPAIKGTNPPRCRMHGGTTMKATPERVKTGRHSKYLPANIEKFYNEALNNPELLELTNHISLLDARINLILETLQLGDPLPRWSQVAEMFAVAETGLLSGKMDEVGPALESIHKMFDSGEKWDSSWDEIRVNIEQLRRVADTEIKRKKDLGQMIPVERVVILMAAVANAVKRNVKDPEAIAAVQRELAMLHYGNEVPGIVGATRVGAIIDVETGG